MSSTISNNRGSILIVVLWTLVMIGYLVGDYLVHNRSKTGTAMNLTENFTRMNAVESVLHLTTTDEWKAALEGYSAEKWVDVTVDGISLRFRLDSEENRLNINTADDAGIRQAVVDIVGSSDNERADRIADAILDWRDPNDLVRVNGAEKAEYEAAGLEYAPADGAFKTLTELLMVQGVTREIFWGDPEVTDQIGEDDSEDEGSRTIDRGNEGSGDEDSRDKGDDADDTVKAGSLLERFTLFDGNTRRLSVLIPLTGEPAGEDTDQKQVRLLIVLFLKGEKSLDVIERYTEMLEG